MIEGLLFARLPTFHWKWMFEKQYVFQILIVECISFTTFSETQHTNTILITVSRGRCAFGCCIKHNKSFIVVCWTIAELIQFARLRTFYLDWMFEKQYVFWNLIVECILLSAFSETQHRDLILITVSRGRCAFGCCINTQ